MYDAGLCRAGRTRVGAAVFFEGPGAVTIGRGLLALLAGGVFLGRVVLLRPRERPSQRHARDFVLAEERSFVPFKLLCATFARFYNFLVGDFARGCRLQEPYEKYPLW